MTLNNFLILSAFLFCTGLYGVLVRKNAVLVLMSMELMLNAVNINLMAFSIQWGNSLGQVFTLFVIAVAAAEAEIAEAISIQCSSLPPIRLPSVLVSFGSTISVMTAADSLAVLDFADMVLFFLLVLFAYEE